MISNTRVTEIFCSFDDFCKEFVPFWERSLSSNGKTRIRKCKMSLSEVMTIEVLFHISGYRNFKTFYKGYVCKHLKITFQI